MLSFADRLTAKIRETGHPLCVGLDPHLPLVPPFVTGGGKLDPADPNAAEIVESFLLTFIDIIADRVAVVKPQAAFYEQMGWRGMRCLENVSRYAQEKNLLVILDAKRGDIGSTADAYAAAYLGPESPYDAITLNPYLGLDSLRPFVDAARANGKGLFILVKTSNPGAKDFQDFPVRNGKVYQKVAAALDTFSDELTGGEANWSGLGAVVGGTYAADAQAVREIMPNALFLVPGYGAQGATAKDALAGFTKADGVYEGGVVSSSRALMFPKDGPFADETAWRDAVNSALDTAVSDLTV